ncbi:hypothetical protein BESB_012120 [Besnoitia besnoiti]|uniref:RNA-editing substrate-binding complex 6 protein domain-containing protein n=1 Tax=Besnoitia besnoiti TaxID=94643 RepID=A0A2A9MB38_BESBE|nr:hypothetical protein BESB_012120 [Besnoitia besnoiti]PFH32600.1 hypothetical protein BESB_012120 [Besnoitia besnoiti]
MEFEQKRDGIELVKKGEIYFPENADAHKLTVLICALNKFGYAADRDLLARYAERALALTPSLYPRHASLILNVFARHRFVDEALLSALGDTLATRLRNANAQDLALIASAYGNLEYFHPLLLKRLGEEIPHKLPHFEPQHVVAVAHAFAKLEIQDSLFFDDVAEQTLRFIEDFAPRPTALIANILGARVRYRNPAFWRELLSHAWHLRKKLEANELIMIAHGASAVDAAMDEEFLKLMTRSACDHFGTLSLAEKAQAINACARVKFYSPQLFDCLANWLSACPEELERLEVPFVCQVLHACGRLRHNDPQLVTPLCRRLAQTALNSAQTPLTPQVIAVSLRALCRLGRGRGAPRLAAASALHEDTRPLRLSSGARASGASAASSLSQFALAQAEPAPGAGSFLARGDGGRFVGGQGEPVSEEDWRVQQELVALLTQEVPRQLGGFTPQGLCESLDALSALGVDNAMLYYCISQELGGKRLWPALSVPGLLAILRAFSRRGAKGDVPLVRRCLTRLRAAIETMDAGECLSTRQALEKLCLDIVAADVAALQGRGGRHGAALLVHANGGRTGISPAQSASELLSVQDGQLRLSGGAAAGDDSAAVEAPGIDALLLASKRDDPRLRHLRSLVAAVDKRQQTVNQFSRLPEERPLAFASRSPHLPHTDTRRRRSEEAEDRIRTWGGAAARALAAAEAVEAEQAEAAALFGARWHAETFPTDASAADSGEPVLGAASDALLDGGDSEGGQLLHRGAELGETEESARRKRDGRSQTEWMSSELPSHQGHDGTREHVSLQAITTSDQNEERGPSRWSARALSPSDQISVLRVANPGKKDWVKDIQPRGASDRITQTRSEPRAYATTGDSLDDIVSRLHGAEKRGRRESGEASSVRHSGSEHPRRGQVDSARSEEGKNSAEEGVRPEARRLTLKDLLSGSHCETGDLKFNWSEPEERDTDLPRGLRQASKCEGIEETNWDGDASPGEQTLLSACSGEGTVEEESEQSLRGRGRRRRRQAAAPSPALQDEVEGRLKRRPGQAENLEELQAQWRSLYLGRDAGRPHPTVDDEACARSLFPVSGRDARAVTIGGSREMGDSSGMRSASPASKPSELADAPSSRQRVSSSAVMMRGRETVDGTGLIIRNCRMQQKAAQEGGFEVGYEDLGDLFSGSAAGIASAERHQRGGGAKSDEFRTGNGEELSPRGCGGRKRKRRLAV